MKWNDREETDDDRKLSVYKKYKNLLILLPLAFVQATKNDEIDRYVERQQKNAVRKIRFWMIRFMNE